jgi:hypothetical protein
VGDECKVAWKELKPKLRATQNMLGNAWVNFKHQQYMQSATQAQKELDSKVVPVVKGRTGELYCLDHHHLLAALDFSGSVLDSTTFPTIKVVCDFSSEPTDAAFWSKMTHHMYAFGRPEATPAALPTPLDPATAFPTSIIYNRTFSAFADDPWRSLAGFIRKLDSAPDCTDGANSHDYGCRGYEKVCDASGAGTPFFEFRWGFFFNAAEVQPALWPTPAALANWQAAYATLPYPCQPGAGSTTELALWQAAAAALFPLARSEKAGSFSVPSEYATIAGPLPGFMQGDRPFPHGDPDCKIPECGNATRRRSEHGGLPPRGIFPTSR